MAVTKKFVIHSRLDDRVGYVLDDDKTLLDGIIEYATNDDKTVTVKKEYKTALNCDLENAYQDMVQTKKRKNSTGGRLGYHIIQSFKPGEVTAATAHQIAIELCKRSFNDYEVVIGTHTDKEHIHSHIVVNSVSFITGKKYRDSTRDLFEGIKATSDEICREHGLSVIVPPEVKTNTTYFEWLARKGKRISWQSLIRMDIDDCIKQAFSYGNFLTLMKMKGYAIKQGKYISFQPMGKERFSRGYKLGHKYSIDSLKRRIAGVDLVAEYKNMTTYVENRNNFNPYPKVKKGSFKALCLYYDYLLNKTKKNERHGDLSETEKEDLVRLDTHMNTINFKKQRNLDTIESVQSYKSKCYETIALIKAEQAKEKGNNQKHSHLFKAVVNMNKYKEAHHLYKLEGFKGMKAEHDAYIKATKLLKDAGYATKEQINLLIENQSTYEQANSTFRSDIRHFRYEIKMCNKALELDKRWEERNIRDNQELQHERSNSYEPKR